MSRLPASTAAIGRFAGLTVRAGLDGPLLGLCASVLHRAPRTRAANSLGWHLGQAAGPAPRIARLRSGGRMVVDVRDYAHRNAFLFGVYEEEVSRLLHRVATPGWTVLDVGANAGYFSLLAADVGGPGSQVVAFEPNPRMRELLQQSLALNPAGQIELVPAACGDRSGSIALSVSPDPRNSGLSTVRDTFQQADQLTVPLLRLDDFCAERGIVPDLVKVDVEGAEEMVLRGAEALLRESAPTYVICEVWADSRARVLDYMGTLGYVGYGIRSDGRLAPASEGDGPWDNLCFRREPAGMV